MMRRAITLQILIFVICLNGLPVRGQPETIRGVGVRMKNEQTRDFETVALYQKSYALVIGESKYKFTSAWKELEGVRKDVPAIARLLKEQGFDEVVVAQDLTRVQLDQTIRGFISKYGLARENRLLIYYAGHGYTETTEDGLKLGYIVPVDAPSPVRQPDVFYETAISMDDIQSYATSIRAKHALFVFDSCFSGTILRKTRATVPPVITLKAALPVRQFITSGAEDQEVPDISDFRKQFEAGVRGEADLNNDTYVTGSELGDFLQEKVTNYSRGSQTPLTGKIANGALDKGDFIFVLKNKNEPKPSRAETTITELTPAEIEREAWLDIQDSANPQTFREFIKEYPAGANVGKAKIKLEQLIWASVKDSRDKAKLQAYLNEFPNGANASRARLKLTELNSVVESPTTDIAANKPKNFKSSIGMEFVLIPAGSFMMGSPASEEFRSDDEVQHRVTITKNFYMGKYEVTQAEWKSVMGGLPTKCDWGSLSGEFVGDNKPIICVSWNDAQEFIRKLNAKGEGKYRLPSEAEWEYAARAGTTTPFAFGNSLSSEQANFSGNYPYGGATKGKDLSMTAPVGSYQANGFGLYDMHGNVSEWVQDGYGNYPSGSVSDPKGATTGSRRVNRGGSWGLIGGSLRSANRGYNLLSVRLDALGFRLVRE